MITDLGNAAWWAWWADAHGYEVLSAAGTIAAGWAAFASVRVALRVARRQNQLVERQFHQVNFDRRFDVFFEFMTLMVNATAPTEEGKKYLVPELLRVSLKGKYLFGKDMMECFEKALVIFRELEALRTSPKAGLSDANLNAKYIQQAIGRGNALIGEVMDVADKYLRFGADQHFADANR